MIQSGTIRAFTMAAESESGKKAAEFLENLKTCDIDKEGRTFKYILLRVTPKSKKNIDPNATKVLVRGYEQCYYHCKIQKAFALSTMKIDVSKNFQVTSWMRLKLRIN